NSHHLADGSIFVTVAAAYSLLTAQTAVPKKLLVINKYRALRAAAEWLASTTYKGKWRGFPTARDVSIITTSRRPGRTTHASPDHQTAHPRRAGGRVHPRRDRRQHGDRGSDHPIDPVKSARRHGLGRAPCRGPGGRLRRRLGRDRPGPRP